MTSWIRIICAAAVVALFVLGTSAVSVKAQACGGTTVTVVNPTSSPVNVCIATNAMPAVRCSGQIASASSGSITIPAGTVVGGVRSFLGTLVAWGGGTISDIQIDNGAGSGICCNLSYNAATCTITVALSGGTVPCTIQ